MWIQNFRGRQEGAKQNYNYITSEDVEELVRWSDWLSGNAYQKFHSVTINGNLPDAKELAIKDCLVDASLFQRMIQEIRSMESGIPEDTDKSAEDGG